MRALKTLASVLVLSVMLTPAVALTAVRPLFGVPALALTLWLILRLRRRARRGRAEKRWHTYQQERARIEREQREKAHWRTISDSLGMPRGDEH